MSDVSKMAKRVPREFRKYVRLAHDQGWRLKACTSGLKLLPPDRTASSVVIHGSPHTNGNGRGNTERDLRKAGLRIP